MSAKPLNLYDPEIDKFIRTRLAEEIAKRDRLAALDLLAGGSLPLDYRQKIYTWSDFERAKEKTVRRLIAKQSKVDSGEWDEP